MGILLFQIQLLNMMQALDDSALGMKVAIKPGGRVTVQILQASILALIPAVRLVGGCAPVWITAPSLVRSSLTNYHSLTLH